MTQQERRSYLIHYLKSENDDLKKIGVPENEVEQKLLLRSLMNIRPPKDIGEDFLSIQDAYLQTEQREKHLVSLADLSLVQKGIYLWQVALFPVMVALIMQSTPQPEYNSVWNVPALWRCKSRRSLLEKRR